MVGRGTWKDSTRVRCHVGRWMRMGVGVCDGVPVCTRVSSIGSAVTRETETETSVMTLAATVTRQVLPL